MWYNIHSSTYPEEGNMKTKAEGFFQVKAPGVIDPETEQKLVEGLQALATTLDTSGLSVVAMFVRIPEDPNDDTKVVPRQALVPPEVR